MIDMDDDRPGDHNHKHDWMGFIFPVVVLLGLAGYTLGLIP